MAMATDSDDGGSFWTTFGGPLGTTAEVSSFEQLLQTPEVSVEALLDEEEVIQEFKAGNERLVSRLSKPDAAKVLFEFITCEPPEQASSKRCFRYPFVAVELMTCGPPQFFQALVRADRPEILGTLWGFLEASPPSEVNPVLAGYFQRTAASIFLKHPTEVVEYLRKRGTDALLERFLERLHLRSLAELFARLLCAEQPSQAVFPTEGLIARLLARLEDPGPNYDTQENVTLVLLELLAQKDSLCYGDEILQQLTSSSTVGFLVDHIFCGRPGSVPASTSILSNIVVHSYVAFKGVSVCASTPTLSPLSPPTCSLAGEDDVVNVGAGDSVVGEAVAAVRAIQSPPHSPSAGCKKEGSAMWLEARSAQLMREICSHLPRLRTLLDESLGKTSSMSMPNGTVRTVGSTTLEVLNLVAMLARTGCAAILEALLQEQLLPRCFELMFRHPWSSLLHNTVKLMLSEILGASDGVRPALLLSFLRDNGLVERLVSEFQEEELNARSTIHKRSPRVGYMGHLHAICCELRDYGSRVPECGAALQAVTGWSDIVLPAVDSLQRVQSEKLGGGVPAEDRGRASSSTAQSQSTKTAECAVKSNLDTDFVLDDLNDVDERTCGGSTAAMDANFCSVEGNDVHMDASTRGSGAAAEGMFSPGVFPSKARETENESWSNGPTVFPIISTGSLPDDDMYTTKTEGAPAGNASENCVVQEQPWMAQFDVNFDNPCSDGNKVAPDLFPAQFEANFDHPPLFDNKVDSALFPAQFEANFDNPSAAANKVASDPIPLVPASASCKLEVNSKGCVDPSAGAFWGADFGSCPENSNSITTHVYLPKSATNNGSNSPSAARTQQGVAGLIDALPIHRSSTSLDTSEVVPSGGSSPSSFTASACPRPDVQSTTKATSLEWSAEFEPAAVASLTVPTAATGSKDCLGVEQEALACSSDKKLSSTDPPSIGTENLFALLGENRPAAETASTGEFQATSPSVSALWPTSTLAPTPQWTAGSASSPPAPSGMSVGSDLFDPFTTPVSSDSSSTKSAPRVDMSCLADFDPLFQPSISSSLANSHGDKKSAGGDLGGALSLNLLQDGVQQPSSTPLLSSTDLASLAPLWPPG